MLLIELVNNLNYRQIGLCSTKKTKRQPWRVIEGLTIVNLFAVFNRPVLTLKENCSITGFILPVVLKKLKHLNDNYKL